MRILVSNDDGILAEGLWALAREMAGVARVTIVAPDRERSAIGTSVTLRHPLRVKPVKTQVPGVDAYSVDGTPSDSVILALGKLIEERVDLVISGVNHGPNLGEDVHISGTVGAALQGYLRGVSAISISAPDDDEAHLEAAARAAAALAGRLAENPPARRIFLNINLPALAPGQIAGARVTRLARESHINTVKEGNHGRQPYYWLDREKLGRAAGEDTDMRAIELGYISITPLYFNRDDRPPQAMLEGLCPGLVEEVRG